MTAVFNVMTRCFSRILPKYFLFIILQHIVINAIYYGVCQVGWNCSFAVILLNYVSYLSVVVFILIGEKKMSFITSQMCTSEHLSITLEKFSCHKSWKFLKLDNRETLFYSLNLNELLK